jgi:hypothetical protein
MFKTLSVAVMLTLSSMSVCNAQIDPSKAEIDTSIFYSRISGLWCSDSNFRGCANLSGATCEETLKNIFTSCQTLVQTSLEDTLTRAEESNSDLPQMLDSEISEINACFTNNILAEQSLDKAEFDECLSGSAN